MSKSALLFSFLFFFFLVHFAYPLTTLQSTLLLRHHLCFLFKSIFCILYLKLIHIEPCTGGMITFLVQIFASVIRNFCTSIPDLRKRTVTATQQWGFLSCGVGGDWEDSRKGMTGEGWVQWGKQVGAGTETAADSAAMSYSPPEPKNGHSSSWFCAFSIKGPDLSSPRGHCWSTWGKGMIALLLQKYLQNSPGLTECSGAYFSTAVALGTREV